MASPGNSRQIRKYSRVWTKETFSASDLKQKGFFGSSVEVKKFIEIIVNGAFLVAFYQNSIKLRKFSIHPGTFSSCFCSILFGWQKRKRKKSLAKALFLPSSLCLDPARQNVIQESPARKHSVAVFIRL